jgi:hypothetical protein
MPSGPVRSPHPGPGPAGPREGWGRGVSRPEETRSGAPAREGAAAPAAGTATTDGGRGGDGWRAEAPVLLGSAALARQPELPADDPAPRPPEHPTHAAPRPVPKGWPGTLAEPVWSWLAHDRPPLPVVVGGAEGGVGTSTVTALIGELLAAASPGPTALVDQSGTGWGSMLRRLVGQRAGLDAQHAAAQLRHGAPPPHILSAAPVTSAGAALLDDSNRYTALDALLGLVATSRGALVVDGGLADLVLAARLDIRPVVVLVGRADVIGAEAVCAALGFLHRHPTPVQPVVVLCSTASTDRRRIQAATKLVATTGISHLVHLPYDARLAHGQPLRLDQVGKTTAAAALAVVSRIGKTQEVLHLVRRPHLPPHPPPRAAAGGSGAG